MKKYFFIVLLANSFALSSYAQEKIPKECIDMLTVMAQATNTSQTSDQIKVSMATKWQSLDSSEREQFTVKCKQFNESYNTAQIAKSSSTKTDTDIFRVITRILIALGVVFWIYRYFSNKRALAEQAIASNKGNEKIAELIEEVEIIPQLPSTDFSQKYGYEKNKFEYILEYLARGSANPSLLSDYELFYYDEETGNDREEIILISVDWRGEEELIIEECETAIKTGDLSFEVADADNDVGFKRYIIYRGKQYFVHLSPKKDELGRYKNVRSSVILKLNEILQPDYELRYLTASEGGDSVILLPLPTKLWTILEAVYGETLHIAFAKLSTQLLGDF